MKKNEKVCFYCNDYTDHMDVDFCLECRSKLNILRDVLNYFEKQSINFFSALINEKKGDYTKIKLSDINITRIISNKIYANLLGEFIYYLNQKAYTQLRGMLYYVVNILQEDQMNKNNVSDEDYIFFGIKK